MKLLIVGSLFGESGYANHTRYLANALFNEGVEIALECPLVNGWERIVNDNELKMLKTSRDNYDAVLMITLPPVSALYRTGKPILQYVVWEGDRIPSYWIDYLVDCDKIIVPSQHTKDAIMNTVEGTVETDRWEEMIKICPHGVDLDIFKPAKVESKDFTFMCSKGWPNGTLDRGGLSFLIKAFMEEFKTDEPVKLSVKLNMAYGMNDQLLNKNMSELEIQNKTPARLEIIPQDLTRQQLCDWYNRGDIYVIPSLAEAFCIPGIEAMACGKPCIFTDFGGQTDYCDKYNGWKLSQGKMIDVDWDLQYEGVKWKAPSIEEFRKVLRYVYEHKEEVDAKGKKALNTAQLFTWRNTAMSILSLVKQIQYVGKACAP